MSSANTKPSISVLVVNFNSGEFLCACVQSVLNSYNHAEIIIIDNASSDHSIHTLEQSGLDLGTLTIIKNTTNLGFATAVNQAAAKARADFLLLLNPDCLLYPQGLEPLHRAILASHTIGIAGGLVINYDGSEQRGCRRHEPTLSRSAARILHLKNVQAVDMTNTPLPSTITPVDAVSGAFMLIRASVFQQLGGMDEAYFLHCEDLDICKRVRDGGYSVMFVPDAVALHYKSASGGMRHIKVEWYKHQGMLYYYNKFYKHQTRWPARLLVRASVVTRWLLFAVFNQLRNALKSAAHLLKRSAPAPQPPCALELNRMLYSSGNWLLVTGASSQIGDFLLPKLAGCGYKTLAITRSSRAGTAANQVYWVKPDFLRLVSLQHLGQWDGMLHLAPIWTFELFSAALAKNNINRIIALSSSSVLSKANSDNPKEQTQVLALKAGEKSVLNYATCHQGAVSIFRPTLIYANYKNKNIAFMLKFIKAFRFFPLVGKGAGLRQPVHADDLAEACLSALHNRNTFGKIYTLNGGETLSYKRMVARIFTCLGLKPRLVTLPAAYLRTMLKIVSKLPGFKFITPDMAERMNTDMGYSSEAAVRDFGYKARGFKPTK